MQYDAGRIEATPGARGTCPLCAKALIAKCGDINVWHWAHVIDSGCDFTAEPESAWHREWKSFFPIVNREVRIGDNIADVVTTRGVIEFQSSLISSTTIIEREKAYGRMVWVVNGYKFNQTFDLRNRDGYVSFRWKHPRRSWFSAVKPLFIDGLASFYYDEYDPSLSEAFGKPGDIFQVRKLHHEIPCGGWGKFISRSEFLSLFL